VFHSDRAGNALCCELLHFLAEQRHRALYNQIGESNGVRMLVFGVNLWSEKREWPQ